MSLRIAFDLDGVLADLGTAYDSVAAQVATARAAASGRDQTVSDDHVGNDDNDEEKESEAESDATAPGSGSRVDQAAIWDAIRAIPNFWTTLSPLEPGGLERLAATAIRIGDSLT